MLTQRGPNRFPRSRIFVRLVAVLVFLALAGVTASPSAAAPSRASVTTSASITLQPAVAGPGDAVTVNGDLFEKKRKGELRLDGVLVGRFDTGGRGRFTTSFTVPSSHTGGNATVAAVAGGSSATAVLTVETVAPAPTLVVAEPTPVVVAPASLLRWAPPSGWEQYRVLEIGAAGGNFYLDDATDYRISAPHLITGPVNLHGGRNIVWIGGHVQINDRAMVGHSQRRGLMIRDNGGEVDGRIVHVEGVRFGGNDLAEGIVTDCPTATVQLQNVRLDQVVLRGAHDRDGTGPYATVGKSHPDVIQTYGSQRELRIDGLTGYSNYQGLFFKEDHADMVRGPIHLRRVNIGAVDRPGEDGYAYAGNRMYFWDAARTGQQFLDAGTVWIEHHRNAGKVAASPNPRPGSYSWWWGAYNSNGVLYPDASPGTAVSTDALERYDSNGGRVIAPLKGQDEIGTYATWPDTAVVAVNGRPGVRNGDDTGPGRVYAGRPPAGDYVPADAVGIGYRSPGWQG